ncbi:Sensor protein CzcS [Pontiella desulfatans]|uniref:histidine kinase n=1 Tax=Pontiella desulfatans TaxID=2750659 RepID=A0A6C2U5R4_PONDE|nr:ATP-binding protein [Pontiella desulfatans]VGO15147.1 Sensor protein CzcS [Pontiella desulfatans]
MPRSFKLKQALYSVALFGILLTGYCVYFLRMSYRVGVERTDNELQAILGKHMERYRASSSWKHLEDRLLELEREDPGKGLVFRMEDYDGNIDFSSATWPPGFDGQRILQAAGSTLDPTLPRSEPATTNRPPFFRRGPPSGIPTSLPVFETVGSYRMMAICNPSARLLFGISLEPLEAELGEFRNNLLLSVPLAFLLLVGGGWVLAQLAMRPVNTIVHTARRVTVLNLDERISVAKADIEFRELIDTINDMLQRLERSFKQAARFSADAAHELKTPLTILQADIEAALGHSADGSDDQRTYMDLLDEVQRLDGILRKLLILSQADAGRIALNRETVDLSELVGELCDDVCSLDPRQETQARIEPGIEVEADRGLLELLLRNLAGNAVKYSQGEPPIILELSHTEGWASLTISNRGIPIPDSERHRVFERFYRVDKGRNRKIDGTGLGLCLALEIAHAHGGTLELIDGQTDETTFRLRLPIRKTAP